jgi:hypothetical protein
MAMTDERDRQDGEQILPPSYTAPIGPEDDSGLIEIRPEEEEQPSKERKDTNGDG